MTKSVDEQEAERHRAKMANRKQRQDEEVAGKTVEEKGLLIVHTGTGKGKSTAAFGLALRLIGRGERVGEIRIVHPIRSVGPKIEDRKSALFQILHEGLFEFDRTVIGGDDNGF